MYYYEMIEAFQVQTATFSATTQLTIPDLANERQGDHARAAELPFRVTSPSNILISIHANIIYNDACHFEAGTGSHRAFHCYPAVDY